MDTPNNHICDEHVEQINAVTGGTNSIENDSYHRPENALDALLDELQTFSKPHPPVINEIHQSYIKLEPPLLPAKGANQLNQQNVGRKGSVDSGTPLLPTQNLTISVATGSLRRLHSYPSGSDTDNSPPIHSVRFQVESKAFGKPPIPERNTDLFQNLSSKRIPPPPPPRTSSKSPLASPTSPNLPPRSPATNLQHIQNVQNIVDSKQTQLESEIQSVGNMSRNVQNRSCIKDRANTLPRNVGSNLQVHGEYDSVISISNSSSCESINSQDGTKKRKEELEQRHQELLKKQKALQEQYARLQQLQRGNNALSIIPPATNKLLKKTGSESNILQKMGLQMSTSQITGSLTNIPNVITSNKNCNNTMGQNNNASEITSTCSTPISINQVYETDIL